MNDTAAYTIAATAVGGILALAGTWFGSRERPPKYVPYDSPPRLVTTYPPDLYDQDSTQEVPTVEREADQ